LDFIAIILHCIQCFDAVSWAAGRASGLKKNIAGWWTWALISPDGVAPSQIVSVSASVNFPLHHKVQKFSSGTCSSRWSRKRGHKTVVVWWWWNNGNFTKSTTVYEIHLLILGLWTLLIFALYFYCCDILLGITDDLLSAITFLLYFNAMFSIQFRFCNTSSVLLLFSHHHAITSFVCCKTKVCCCVTTPRFVTC